MKLQLIEDWRHAWKLHSVQGSFLGFLLNGGLAAGVSGAGSVFAFGTVIPIRPLLIIATFMCAFSMVGRFVMQKKPVVGEDGG